MYCKKCGTENADGARFCKKCGEELTRPTAQQPNRPVETPTQQPTERYTPPEEFARPAVQQAAQQAAKQPQPEERYTPPEEFARPGVAPNPVSDTSVMPQIPMGSPQQPQGPQNKKRTVAIIACAVVAVVAIAVTVFVVMTRNKIPKGATGVSDTSYYTATDESHINKDENTGLEYADNELIVYAKPGVTQKQVEDIMADYGGVLIGHSAASNSYQFRLPRSLTYEELREIAARLKALEPIDDVVINPIIRNPIYLKPVDPSQPSDPSNPSQPGDSGKRPVTPEPPEEPRIPDSSVKQDPYATWGTDAIKAEAAWKALGSKNTQGGPGSSVKIGILDNQFYAEHPALKGAFADMYPTYGEGFSAWYNSPEYLGEGSALGPTHGTHVAGIIAAQKSDDGMVGVAYGATLYGWQDGMGAADNGADGNPKPTADTNSLYGWTNALDYLVGECGCKVVNVSAGFGDPNELEPADREFFGSQMAIHLRALVRNGHEFVICCSAGNDTDIDAYKNSVFNLVEDPDIRDRIIVVGSLSREKDGSIVVSDYSSGGDRVDVLAPGGQILSTIYTVNADTKQAESEYAFMSGTSMAAPMVSGVAALVFKANPDLSGAQVKKIICEADGSSQMFAGTGANFTPSRRMVDAEQAVKRAQGMTGEAGRLTSQLKAQDFVDSWYWDWYFATNDGGKETFYSNMAGDNAYPQRLFSLMDQGSAAYKDFNAGDSMTYPKGPWCCSTGEPTATYVSSDGTHDVFEVSIDFVSVDVETPDEATCKKAMKGEAKKAVWRIGVNKSGLVDYVKNVSGYEKSTIKKDDGNQTTPDKPKPDNPKPDDPKPEPDKPEPDKPKPSEPEPEPAEPAIEVGTTNFDLSSDGEYLYFFNAREGDWMSLSSHPQIVRMPLTDESKQEVIWTSPEEGGLGMFAIGEGKILYGVSQYGDPTTIHAYSMNLDGSDVQTFAPMDGIELHGALRPCIHDGRVYYLTFQSASVTQETMQLRSCKLDGSDDKLICEETSRSTSSMGNYILGVVDGQVVFTRSFITNAGTHPSVVYTAPADGSAAAPTMVVTNSSIQPFLAGDRIVYMEGATVKSASVTGKDVQDIATLDGMEDTATLFGDSPSYMFIYCAGTKANGYKHHFYRVDLKTKQVHELGDAPTEGSYNIVGDNVYMSSYGNVVKYDADFNKVADLIKLY